VTTNDQRPWRGNTKAVEGETLYSDPTTSGPTAEGPPEAADLAALVAILTRLADTIDRQTNKPRVEPMTLRVDELAEALGVSRRAIERERSAGRFPAADLTIGKMPLWRVETIRNWLTQPDRQGRRSGR
jgi:hypothetical protein